MPGCGWELAACAWGALVPHAALVRGFNCLLHLIHLSSSAKGRCVVMRWIFVLFIYCIYYYSYT